MLAGAQRYPNSMQARVAALALRFLSHLISGVVFFGMNAPEGTSPIVYSALYNGAYMLPEIIISGILVYLLIKRGVLDYNI